MTSIIGTVFGGGERTVVSAHPAERRASPFRSRGARSASVARVRTAEAQGSSGYLKICEEVFSPFVDRFDKEIKANQADMDDRQLTTRKKVDELKQRINHLEEQNRQLENQCNTCLYYIENGEFGMNRVWEDFPYFTGKFDKHTHHYYHPSGVFQNVVKMK